MLNDTVVSPSGDFGLSNLNFSVPAITEAGAGMLLLYTAAATGAYVILEQLRFRMKSRKKGGKSVPGPDRIIPFLGGLITMVMDPYKFWEDQRSMSEQGFSYNSLFGRFILFVTDAAKCREIMAVNDPSKMLMVLHPSAKSILGANNIAFIHGPEHKDLRKSFMHLFTRKALSIYISLQDGIIRRHIDEWFKVNGNNEFEIRPFVRDLNQFTSQEVFVGPYLDDPTVRSKFSKAYSDITDGFLAFPFCFPGTTVWRARQGRFYVLKVLKMCVDRSRTFIKSGGEPRCLMDFWVNRCLEEIKEAQEAGLPPPKHTTDFRMADAMLDFLFASQDASTASLVWTTTLMADHPDILEKVRAEQYALRGNDLEKTIDGDMLHEMTYTRQVVKEILRYRAPAPMVPQMCYGTYQLTDDYAIPKGTLVCPSINSANMQGFTDAQKFDPERFNAERKEDIIYGKNYLTFGAGAHYCVGKEYAVNHLVCYLAILSTSCNWTRRRTDKSDEWQYLPTIYPYDSFITFERRE